MAEAIGIEVVKELVKQLSAVSKKAYMCKSIAKNLATTIADFQPTILEIMDSSGESSEHRQDQLRMFFDNLEECRMLTEKVLKCKRWNFVRQINYVKKMEDLDRKIYRFSQTIVPLHTLADVRHLRGAVDRMSKNVHRSEQVTMTDEVTRAHGLAEILRFRDTSRVSFDRIDNQLDLLNKMASLKTDGSVSGELGDATMKMVTDGDLDVGFDLSKGKVKNMLFKSTDEARLAVDRMNKNVHRSEQVTYVNAVTMTDVNAATMTHVQSLRDTSRVRFDRMEIRLNILIDKMASLKIDGSVSGELGDATMKMGTDGDLGIGFHLSKGKVKKMLFKSTDEGRLIGI